VNSKNFLIGVGAPKWAGSSGATTTYTERLTLSCLLRAFFLRRQTYYLVPSVPVRVVLRVLARLGLAVPISLLTLGQIETATGIRRAAYEEAESQIENIYGADWIAEVGKFLGINFGLIVRKFFFDELYRKYEFYKTARQHAVENSSSKRIMYLDDKFACEYPESLANQFEVRRLRHIPGDGLFMLMILPIFLLYYALHNRAEGNKCFQGGLVFQIDGEKLYEMFQTLFGEFSGTYYVMERWSALEPANLKDAEWRKEAQISTLGISKSDFRYLRKALVSYVGSCLKHFRVIRRYRTRLFGIFYLIMRGRAEAINGSGNWLITYEHPVTLKAIRNELLRSDGNRSVYIVMNAGDSPTYWAEEIFVNYDIMCVGGSRSAELYRKKYAMCSVIPPVGSYDAQRGPKRLTGRAERISRLKAFKGNSVAISIMSPGLCGMTESHEKKLMALAKTLAGQSGVKVFVRQKPTELAAKYGDFYTDFFKGCEGVMLTKGEYELWDFLDVSDLVISSISYSACDLAVGGAQVMYVDFHGDPELIWGWTNVPEIVIRPEDALDRILEWVKDVDSGPVRQRHAQFVSKFVNGIDFQHSDISAYKKNLLSVLKTQSVLKNY
jgi:hypothetical protein